MEPNEKPKFDWKRLLITTGIVLVATLVVGGTTWYVMDKSAKEVQKANEESIAALEKQIDEKSTTSKTSAATKTNNLETLSPVTLDPLSAKIGDKFGGMTLATLSSIPADQGNPLGNTTATFSGSVTVKVKYTYTAPGEPSMFGEFIQFEVEDKDSLLKIPVLKNDTRMVWFAPTPNTEIARLKPLLGLGTTGSTGSATLTINNYRIVYAPTEVFNTASIINVVK